MKNPTKKKPTGVEINDLRKILQELYNKAHNKFERLDFTERESRITGYRQALKDLGAKFYINL